MYRMILLTVCCCMHAYLFSNDGVFYASGMTLVPKTETRIELRKEILTMKKIGNYMRVYIYFEFYNPGDPIVETVGFVTPPPGGDISDDSMKHPQIFDFQVQVHDSLLPYKISKLETSGFKLSEHDFYKNDFIYHFTVPFKKGINIVRHTYLYRGGNSVDEANSFFYRLTTGATWANKKINDFELNIDMGEEVYFHVPNSFSSKKQMASWTIVGTGRIAQQAQNVFDQDIRMVYIKNGYITLKASNFVPETDLYFGIYHPYVWLDLMDEKGTFEGIPDVLRYYDFNNYDPKDLETLTSEELRFIRNFIYARKGYMFNAPDLQALFNRFSWYIPDPNLKDPSPLLTTAEKQLIDNILAEENKRK
ncbi:MAG: YARHG domain-containing protein [Chitinophagales bacterium]|nr:YARHG domain-containing protein [Chitinophagales bacterium]